VPEAQEDTDPEDGQHGTNFLQGPYARWKEITQRFANSRQFRRNSEQEISEFALE